MRLSRVGLALLALTAGHPLCARAQPARQPSAEDMIAALKPPTALRHASRGIRAAATPAAPTAATAPPKALAGAPPAIPPGLIAPGSPGIDLDIRFEFGSAELTDDAARALDFLGTALSSQALLPYRFRIEGHTDTVGTADYNRSLSAQRAAAVARYLEARFGVGAGRLETVGLGESMPLVPTPPQTPESRNRRVHVVNLGA